MHCIPAAMDKSISGHSWRQRIHLDIFLHTWHQTIHPSTCTSRRHCHKQHRSDNCKVRHSCFHDNPRRKEQNSLCLASQDRKRTYRQWDDIGREDTGKEIDNRSRTCRMGNWFHIGCHPNLKCTCSVLEKGREKCCKILKSDSEYFNRC